jgi:hypothetical protein
VRFVLRQAARLAEQPVRVHRVQICQILTKRRFGNRQSCGFKPVSSPDEIWAIVDGSQRIDFLPERCDRLELSVESDFRLFDLLADPILGRVVARKITGGPDKNRSREDQRTGSHNEGFRAVVDSVRDDPW